MRCQVYNRLQQEKQLELVKVFGVLLLECKRFNFRLRLFQLYKFYVEVYSTQKRGDIVSVNAFEDVSNLDPYLSEIDISELMDMKSE